MKFVYFTDREEVLKHEKDNLTIQKSSEQQNLYIVKIAANRTRLEN